MPYVLHFYGIKQLIDLVRLKVKLVGGMALPNFTLHYDACTFCTITVWLDHTFTHPTWIQMEREECIPYEIGALILSPIKIDNSTYNNNNITHSIIRIWKQIKSQFKIEFISTLLPIARNPSFVPSTSDSGFTQWIDFDIWTIGDLLMGILTPSLNFRPNMVSISTTTLDSCRLGHTLRNICRERHLVSQLYNSLLSRTSPSVQGIKTGWEQELGVEIDGDLWDDALENIHKCSANSRHRLIQFKIVHRLHYAKTNLHKIFSSISPICDKCLPEEATLPHS